MELTLEELTTIHDEIALQPSWRQQADREMDYVDGNQLDSEILQLQKRKGIPPAIEPIIGPQIEAVVGYEAKTRTDWRVTPDSDLPGSDEVAKALNYELNKVERHSGADRACSDAFKPMVACGLGWVEVARESDPFKFKFRCKYVSRNEVWWDMKSKEMDLSDCRWLVRRRWTHESIASLRFPDKADLIKQVAGGWSEYLMDTEGGTSTGLAMAYDDERGWSVEEAMWRDVDSRMVCIYEVWYRRWESVPVIRTRDGRIVEYDSDNVNHSVAVASGVAKVKMATVSRVRLSYWIGPHKMFDGPSPYKHNDYPYVPFVAHREDRTGVPFGRVRGMMFLQDNINSAISKIRWGLSATRTERTKGAVDMTDAQFREMIGRPDADIILNADHMAQPGAKFEVFRDFQLNEQQYKMLQDSRLGIERASGIQVAFQGGRGTATSGVQESTQVEQSTQALAGLMDNFRWSRTRVGELLMSMIIEDMGTERTEILIRGNAVVPEETIILNDPTTDDETGVQYLTNDVQRVRLKVALQDVPSTPSFRTQQLSSMSEAFKSMPQEIQVIALPHLLNLMDIPDKDEIIKAIQEARQQSTPEQIQAQIEDAVNKAGLNLKARELELKYSPERMQAEIQEIINRAVKAGAEGAYASMQAAQTIATMPQIAPVADVVMQHSGWRQPNPAGQDPNYPQVQANVPAPVEQTNTSPQLPPVPQEPSAMQGIETMRNDGVVQ